MLFRSPNESDIIENDIYVDDLLTGCDTLGGLQHYCNNINKILMTGNFSLRKWKFNTPDLKIDNCSKDGIKHFADTTTKTLGIIFDSYLDQFEFIFNDFNIIGPITKRKILAKTAGMFDPLGLLSPITIVPKIQNSKFVASKVILG